MLCSGFDLVHRNPSAALNLFWGWLWRVLSTVKPTCDIGKLGIFVYSKHGSWRIANSLHECGIYLEWLFFVSGGCVCIYPIQCYVRNFMVPLLKYSPGKVKWVPSCHWWTDMWSLIKLCNTSYSCTTEPCKDKVSSVTSSRSRSPQPNLCSLQVSSLLSTHDPRLYRGKMPDISFARFSTVNET